MENLEKKTDEELFFMMNNGSKDKAFSELYQRYKNYFLYVALGIVKNKEDAEDIVQDCFINIYQKTQNYELKNCKAKTLFYRIVANKSITKFRENKKDVLKNSTDLDYGLKYEVKHNLEKKEFQKRTKEEYKNLDMNYKKAYNLIDIQGLKYREASEILDLNINTLKRHICQARKIIAKNILKKYGKNFFYQ